MNLLSELKRRKVFRVAVVYAATAFAVLQAAEIMLPRMGLPDWVMNLLVLLTVLGFPLALVLGWALELRPDGRIQRTEASAAATETPAALGKRTVLIAGFLVVLGVGLSAGWLLKPASVDAPTKRVDAPAEAADRQSIAVLPFDSLSDDPEQGYFADGLTEEILNALAALPKLLVTARTSAFFYKDKDVPVDEIADRLGVEHILEGSVRRSGDQMRVTAQLIRADDGFHLWSQTYDRPVDDAFAVQTDIATQVASALGILLDDNQRARMEAAGVRDPEAYALFAKGFERYRFAHGGAPLMPVLIEANALFDRAFERASGLWVARYLSADLYTHILLDQSTGIEHDTLPAEYVDNARLEHGNRLRDAARAAPNAAARDFIEVTRRLVSDNWTGLRVLLDRAFEHEQACGFDQWMQSIGPPFGMQENALGLFLRGTRCNALDASNWLHAGLAALYGGDSARALAIGERGMTISNETGGGLGALQIQALIALGQFDEARTRLSLLEESAIYSPDLGRAWVLAAEGNRDALASLVEQIRHPSDMQGVATQLSLAARSGDRESANAIAAAVDAEPAGALVLITGIYYCLCGAPFDLDETPNLARRLDEAGLDWPPVETINWPLKDW